MPPVPGNDVIPWIMGDYYPWTTVHMRAAKVSKLSKHATCCGMVKSKGEMEETNRSLLPWIFETDNASSEKYFWYHLLESVLGLRSFCLFLLNCAVVGPDFPMNTTDSMKP